MANFQQITQSVMDGAVSRAVELTRAALSTKVPAKEILDKGLIPGIRKAGELFGCGQFFLPELLVAAKAMSAATEILEPELSKAKVPPAGRYVIGTVRGDLHDIGKNVVVMMLRGNGWQVADLGVDVSSEDFCAAVTKGDYQILGMSALLTTTMPVARETIEALKSAGLREKIKIMVGGAPTTREWAEKIGADGYASDAAEAVAVAEALIRK
jgi:5-methyltetrahydrofolate--homocysteine methyltransferase